MNFNEIESIPAESKNGLKVQGQLKIISSNKEKGFNFDYVLYIPDNIQNYTTLIVEAANANLGSSDIKKAQHAVREYATDCDLPIYQDATELGMPILYPIFPRWHNGKEVIYNHMLASNSLDMKTERIKESGLERVDLQLIQMINDAKEKFQANGIQIDDKIIIDGFSASAKFANRFTLLHPELVKMCIAGGVSGQLTLPLEEINGEKLLWPVGIGNLKELTGESLTLEKINEFKNVKQLYYMGLDDTNDPFALKEIDTDGNYIPRYPEIIKPNEIKQLYEMLGSDMVNERWQKSQTIYQELGVDATFKSYEGFGHTPGPACNDITTFIQSNLSKEHEKQY